MHRKACNEVKWDEKKMKNSKPSTSKWLLVTFAEVNPLFWTVITRQRENHKKMKIKEGN